MVGYHGDPVAEYYLHPVIAGILIGVEHGSVAFTDCGLVSNGAYLGAVLERIAADERHGGRDRDRCDVAASVECAGSDGLQPFGQGDGRDTAAYVECIVVYRIHRSGYCQGLETGGFREEIGRNGLHIGAYRQRDIRRSLLVAAVEGSVQILTVDCVVIDGRQHRTSGERITADGGQPAPDCHRLDTVTALECAFVDGRQSVGDDDLGKTVATEEGVVSQHPQGIWQVEGRDVDISESIRSYRLDSLLERERCDVVISERAFPNGLDA